jgi:hypothetical protein
LRRTLKSGLGRAPTPSSSQVTSLLSTKFACNDICQVRERRVCGWRAMHGFSFSDGTILAEGCGRATTTSPGLLYGKTIFMKKSGMVRPEKKARRGRPPSGGHDPMVAIRMAKALIANADAWARANGTGRSEAIRRLVELGLSVKTTAKQPSAARGVRAKQLAAQAIDKMVDPTLHPDERAQRRRRLTKGPEEFRNVRVDRPKTKDS